MAPRPDGDLYVSIRTSDGAVVARLDRNGSPRPGWPIEVSHATACGLLLVVEDGSIRVVCNGTDLPEPDNDLSDMRAFAFDRAGRLMAGWPVQLRPSGTARMIDDELRVFAERWVTDTYDIDTVSHVAWMTTVAADGSIRTGTNVPMVEGCCGERWAIGPDGVAYGTIPEYGGSPEAPRSSELLVVSLSGVPTGFPVAIDGLASPPAFDSAGRLHVTVNDGPERLARTIVFDTAGRLQAGGSGALGISATDSCVGIEGSCEVPMAPLVGSDGTTFVVGSYFDRTAAVEPVRPGHGGLAVSIR